MLHSFERHTSFTVNAQKVCITDVRRLISRKIVRRAFSIHRMKLIETGASNSIEFGAETVNDRAKSRRALRRSNADEARSAMRPRRFDHGKADNYPTGRRIEIPRRDTLTGRILRPARAIDGSLDRPPIIHIDTTYKCNRVVGVKLY